jgi:hypothetical protein
MFLLSKSIPETTMKKYSPILALLLLAACAESTEPVTPSTTMHMTKERITLNTMMPMDSSIVFLECGCKFSLSIENMMGDTSIIHCTTRDASNSAHRVALDVSADPAAPVGSYSTRYAIKVHSDSKGTYRDTIEVEYTSN